MQTGITDLRAHPQQVGQLVQRAPATRRSEPKGIEVDQRGGGIRVPAQLLERPDVGDVLQPVRRERAPAGVAGRSPREPRGPRWVLHGPRRHGLGKVLAPPRGGRFSEGGPRSEEDPLPGPGRPLPRSCAVERVRERDPACALGDLGLVLLSRGIEVRAQVRGERPRQPRDAVAVSVPLGGREEAPAEIDVLLAQPAARLPSRPSGGVQGGHPPVHANPWDDDRADVVEGPNHREALRRARPHGRSAPLQLGAADVAVEGEQRGDRLVLGRRATVRAERDSVEGPGHALRAEVRRISLSVEPETPPRPAAPGLHRLGAAVPPDGGGASPIAQGAA